jgi:hypothetical protein
LRAKGFGENPASIVFAFKDITGWTKSSEYINGVELFFKDRDHLIEKWETLKPDGTKTYFEFELTLRAASDRQGTQEERRNPLIWIRLCTQTVFQLALTGTRRYNIATKNTLGSRLSMKTPIPNINAVRSAWRRVKRDIKEAIIRDLQPVKDVKGGGGVRSQSKLITGGTGTRRGQ